MKFIVYLIKKVLRNLKPTIIYKSSVDKTSKIASGSDVRFSIIGKYSYVAKDSLILYTSIGNFCSLGSNIRIGGPSHPSNWISTSPIFYKGKNPIGKNFSKLEYNPFKSTTIKNDVWIGDNVLIKQGVTIGNGSIIGMGSVVTKNIGDYEIWAGNPAKLIRTRFSFDIIEKLNKIAWWNKDDDYLRKHGTKFDDIGYIINME